MDNVVQKIERYFGRHEFGVYKEAEGPALCANESETPTP